MIQSSNDIIYNRLKDKVGFHRSKKYKKYFHEKNPGKIMHHCFGSYSQKIKTSDYCCIPLTVEEHDIAEKNKSEYAIDNLHNMVKEMQGYIIFLEDQLTNNFKRK